MSWTFTPSGSYRGANRFLVIQPLFLRIRNFSLMNYLHLLADKDEPNFHPEGWVVSSESCSFQAIGAKYYREVIPGRKGSFIPYFMFTLVLYLQAIFSAWI